MKKRRFFFDKRNPSCSSPFFSHDVLLDGALKDYCTCFSLDSERTDALVEAIVLAMDYGEYKELKATMYM